MPCESAHLASLLTGLRYGQGDAQDYAIARMCHTPTQVRDKSISMLSLPLACPILEILNPCVRARFILCVDSILVCVYLYVYKTFCRLFALYRNKHNSCLCSFVRVSLSTGPKEEGGQEAFAKGRNSQQGFWQELGTQQIPAPVSRGMVEGFGVTARAVPRHHATVIPFEKSATMMSSLTSSLARSSFCLLPATRQAQQTCRPALSLDMCTVHPIGQSVDSAPLRIHTLQHLETNARTSLALLWLQTMTDVQRGSFTKAWEGMV